MLTFLQRKMVLSKTADWEEEFSFKCSMSPTKSGKFPFEDKAINFVILEEDAPGKKGKPLGKVHASFDPSRAHSLCAV